MCDECCQNRENKHILVPSKTLISYEDTKIPTNFSIPRVYTTTHNDARAEVYIHIGKSLNKAMLAEDEPVKNETQVVGKWKKNSRTGKYEIVMEVTVSTLKNPLAMIRNKIFCENMSMVLEGIALAEQGMLLRNPEKKRSKIYVQFRSVDSKYNRVEYWGRLERWE